MMRRALLPPVVVTLLVVAQLGCPSLTEVDEELHMTGSLDRDSIAGSDDALVPVDYRSSEARAEWWPCDLRLTAQGCVGEHHVNVYVALPSATSFDDVGGAACVSGDTAYGVYEVIEDAGGQSEHVLGSELNAFVLVASDAKGEPGAVLNDDEETTAATRLAGGTLRVTRWAGLEHIGLVIEGETAEGRDVTIEFNGPASSPRQVPVLEEPATCVESALLEP